MQGLMQDRPLTLSGLLTGMERQFADSLVITSYPDGPVHSTYAEILERVHALAIALDGLGAQKGARVATFAWNTQRHLELYLAVPCSGRVLHTVNHRLFAEQIEFILTDAADEIVFADRSMIGPLWPVLEKISALRHIVVMDDGTAGSVPDDGRILDYDALLASGLGSTYDFSISDERTASGLCYTSGTTGLPKGVLYDHRSTVLHALMLQVADGYAIRRSDVVFPIVPMFHVNAWGFPYAALMCGSTLSLPGSVTTADRLAEQMERDRITLGAAVTTVWTTIAPHLDGRDLSSVRHLICGGGRVPLGLARHYQATAGVHLSSGWGMTETSPAATYIAQLDPGGDNELDRLTRPGPSLPLVDFRIVDPPGSTDEILWDGRTPGELQVSGPTIAGRYFNRDADVGFTEDGWLRTGDIAVIDPNGAPTIVDRVKDLIKSGGEWISSADLENVLADHPSVSEVAVIGRSDDRWGERPVACVVLAPRRSFDASDMHGFLEGKVAKWWIPDEVAIVDALPKTATGKISKIELRESLVPSEGSAKRPEQGSLS
ncbi:long-chain-fatty-acid--CoA ligase [Rhodococcus fascians]|nr:long-chain-fatty-acid--CoA ligase [Rhodococcus fascians]MBY4114674.1 long-chain-fatty-acid--CoA ligase [Rhodococcus fascians]